MNRKTPAPITLLPAGPPISGTVVDADKKPVAGARVKLSYWSKSGAPALTFLADGPLQAKWQTTTDAAGGWTLGVLPSGVTATITVLAPGFARAQTEIAGGSRAQTVLHAGARFTGRLLGLDGKPLPDVRVYAQPTNDNPGREGYGEDKTGKDGTFVLGGLNAGVYNVMFQPGEEELYVIAGVEGVEALVGAPVQLPDSQAVKGVLIGGKVTERGTTKGIQGIEIGVYGAANPSSSAAVSSATTGKNGEWTKRTLPGPSKVYVMGATQEFVRDQGQKNLEIPVTGKSDLNFELSRAAKITGRLVDENGRGVHTSALVFRQKYEEYAIQSDEQGNFSAFGPSNGEVEVSRSRWNSGASDEDKAQWDVVGTTKFAVQGDKSLEIKLKRAQVSSLELGVFDQNDAAIEGVKVVLNLMSGEGDGQTGQSRELLSDKTGRVHLGGIRADESVSIQSASKVGFDAALLPKIEKQNGVYRADLSLARRDGKASGDVLDARGAVAANASVFGSGIESASDGAGHFALTPLPSGKTEVIAFKDEGFALGTSDQTRLELRPQTLEPTDAARAKAVLDALREETRNTNYWRRDSLGEEPVGGDFDTLATKATASGDIRDYYRLTARFGANASIAPSKWIALFQGAKKSSDRLYAVAMWTAKAPSVGEGEASRGLLASLENDVTQIEAGTDAGQKWQNAIGIFGAAALAERLGQTERADALFERGHVFVLKNFPETGGKNGGNPSQDDTFGVMGDVVAVSPRFLTKLVALVDSDSGAYSRLLQEGAPVVARLSGLKAARPFLDQLKNAPTPKPNADGNSSSIEWSFAQAVTNSIIAGGKANPKLALDLAQALPPNAQLGGEYGRDRAVVEAAFFQSPGVAQGLWRESLPRLEASAAMRFIARIFATDEPLARGFYEVARRDLDALPQDDPNSMIYHPQPQTTAFAFYEARFAPARARYRLEKGFQLAQRNPNARYDLGRYARAMAVFDATRAIQWATQIGADDSNGFAGFEAKRQVARWLTLDAAARQKASFGDRFGNGDSDF